MDPSAAAPASTARRLALAVKKGECIALGTATDPYQPGEAQARVTRGFLELVAQHRNVRLGIVTKGALILRDLDLLRRIHARSGPVATMSISPAGSASSGSASMPIAATFVVRATAQAR